MENIAEQETVMEELVAADEEAATMNTWEEFGETKNNKFKEIATNKNVQVAAAATTISGIIGFLLGKAHEQKVQKKLLEKISEVILEARQALLNEVEVDGLEASEMLNTINSVTGLDEEKYSDVKTTLEASADLALEEIERLSKTSKFNVIAHNRAKQWIKVNKELSALVMLVGTVNESRKGAIEALLEKRTGNNDNTKKQN